MKIYKTTALFAVLLFCAQHVQAQNQNTINPNGNVGIGTGTSLPTEKLQVRGNVKVDSALTVITGVDVGEDLKVQGNANIEGELHAMDKVYFPNTAATTTLSDEELLLIGGDGQLKRVTLPMMLGTIYKPFSCAPGSTFNPVWSNGPSKLYVDCPDDVKVGIGVINPTHTLHVAGNELVTGTMRINGSTAIGAEPSTFSRFLINNPTQDAGLQINQSGNTKAYGKLLMMEYTNATTEIMKVTNSVTNNVAFLLTASGQMTVHNGIRKTLQLNVDGTLYARRVRVDPDNWADFVFEKDYPLMPLKEVKQFIGQYKHLPDVPSEKEIMEKGIDLAEMNKILMQKVEELTLYLIQLEEKVELLQPKK